MSRRAKKPVERLSQEDPDDERALQRALHLSRREAAAPRPAPERFVAEPAKCVERKKGARPAKKRAPSPATLSGRKGSDEAPPKKKRRSAKEPDDKTLTSTQYLGVEFSTASRAFRATARSARGHDYCLGWFATATEAAACYDETARATHGPGAPCNFSKSPAPALPLFGLTLPEPKQPKKARAPAPPPWYETLLAGLPNSIAAVREAAPPAPARAPTPAPEEAVPRGSSTRGVVAPREERYDPSAEAKRPQLKPAPPRKLGPLG
mmetsp:Transcript_24242/g.72742  ORF Transcript_24242/g.72742 Transcript_24242/m.72742 type:complete len:265 (+) Transcript_24242:270-1064(+)